MALDWADTGGSQFFITHSPQPHLDARYTVFGQVIAGMDVVDQLARGDVIRRVRVWNGVHGVARSLQRARMRPRHLSTARVDERHDVRDRLVRHVRASAPAAVGTDDRPHERTWSRN